MHVRGAVRGPVWNWEGMRSHPFYMGPTLSLYSGRYPESTRHHLQALQAPRYCRAQSQFMQLLMGIDEKSSSWPGSRSFTNRSPNTNLFFATFSAMACKKNSSNHAQSQLVMSQHIISLPSFPPQSSKSFVLTFSNYTIHLSSYHFVSACRKWALMASSPVP